VSLVPVRNNQKAKNLSPVSAEKLFTGVNDTTDKIFCGVSNRRLESLANISLPIPKNEI
jgi:hypothetical protein